MYSISFPDMLSSTHTNLKQDNKAVLQNIKLLLSAEKSSLFGDPDYGCVFKRVIYQQNNYVLKDLIIDEILNILYVYVPQIKCIRKNITLQTKKDKLYCKIKCLLLPEYTEQLFDFIIYEI